MAGVEEKQERVAKKQKKVGDSYCSLPCRDCEGTLSYPELTTQLNQRHEEM
jgi:hypothetical protein